MAKAGKHGVTETTPQNIPFGAGTIHKNLKYTAPEGATPGSWNFDTSIIGATSGGSKLSIVPEISNIEVDGALVKIKGISDVKTGGTATMDVNFVELNKDIIKTAVIGQDGTSADEAFDLVEDKALISTGDYLDNIAFVGKTLDGKKIIAILDNALCTSGMELEGKNKEAGVVALTFECYADNEGDLDVLPWHIYYPKTIEG